MRKEDLELQDEIQDKIFNHRIASGEFNKIPSVIVVDFGTFQRLKNIAEKYIGTYQAADGEHRYQGIPVSVKIDKKEKEISVY